MITQTTNYMLDTDLKDRHHLENIQLFFVNTTIFDALKSCFLDHFNGELTLWEAVQQKVLWDANRTLHSLIPRLTNRSTITTLNNAVLPPG